ncbi:MAG: sugar-binding protein [Bacillota bacterium]
MRIRNLFFCFMSAVLFTWCSLAAGGENGADFPAELKDDFPPLAELIWYGYDAAPGSCSVLMILYKLAAEEGPGRIYQAGCYKWTDAGYANRWQSQFSLPDGLFFHNALLRNIDLDQAPDLILAFFRSERSWYSVALSGQKGELLHPADLPYYYNDSGPAIVPVNGWIYVPWRIYWHESPYLQTGNYHLRYRWDGSGITPAFRRGDVVLAWPRRDGFNVDDSCKDWPDNAGNCHSFPADSRVYWQMDAWGGDKDLSANIAVLWDRSGMYFLLKIKDNVVHPAEYGSEPWRGDLVEMWFDWRMMEDFASEDFNDDDVQLGVIPPNNDTGVKIVALGGEPWFGLDKAVVKGGLTHTGYWLEVKIPWPRGFEPGNTAIIGFAVSVSDTDAGEKPMRTIISSQPGFRWRNPASFGNLIFLDKAIALLP